MATVHKCTRRAKRNRGRLWADYELTGAGRGRREPGARRAAVTGRTGGLPTISIADEIGCCTRAPFERIAVLKEMVAGTTADTLTLTNGMHVACYPCRPAAVRGVRAKVVCLQEFAFFRNSENQDISTEMLRAITPTLATAEGRLVIMSSLYAATRAISCSSSLACSRRANCALSIVRSWFASLPRWSGSGARRAIELTIPAAPTMTRP